MEMHKDSGYDKDDGMFVNTQFIADWEVPWIKDYLSEPWSTTV